MRISIHQRIWRQAQRSRATAPALHIAPACVTLTGSHVPAFTSMRSLHSTTSTNRSILQRTTSTTTSKVTNALAGLHIQSRTAFTASNQHDDEEDDEHEALHREVDHTERVRPTEVLDSEADTLDMLERAYTGAKNWRVARDILDNIVQSNGEGLTENIATALIEVFAVRGRTAECLETLRFARDHGVRPRIHAYSSTIAACYKDTKYAQALRVFEIMRNDGYVPQHVTYSRALSAAVKASHHELVLEIFDDMLRSRIHPSIVTYNTILNSCARNGDAHTALGVLRAIRQQNLEMTQSSYHSLAICGGKAGRWEMTRDAYEGVRASGFKPSMNMYNSVMSAFAKGKQWESIITVFNDMPQEMRDMLQHTYLAAVLMAFAKSSDPAVRDRVVEVFNRHKALGHELNIFAHNALILYYLEAGQYERLHEVAAEIKKRGLLWDGLTYQYIIIAHVRAGNIKKAEQLLIKHGKHMKYSTLCYREVIEYHGYVLRDPLTACRFSMQMMQHNPRLSRQDWITALTFALQAGNRSVYWNFRKWKDVRATNMGIPEELLLNEDDEVKLPASLSTSSSSTSTPAAAE